MLPRIPEPDTDAEHGADEEDEDEEEDTDEEEGAEEEDETEVEASSEAAAPEGAEVEDQTEDDDDCQEGLESEEDEDEETEGEDAASPGREEGTEVEASSEEAAPEGAEVEDQTENEDDCQEGLESEEAEDEETEGEDAASPVLEEEQAPLKTFFLEEEQAPLKTFLLPDSPEAQRTALWEAAGSGNVDVVELLLVSGVDVDFGGNPQGDSPLTQAAFNGHEEVVRILLAHGANVEWVDHDAFGALHNAAYNGHVNVVKLLISPPFYANVHARNKRLELPSDLTADEDIKQILLQERLRRSVFEAVTERHVEALETLLAAGARCDFKDIKGSTAVHMGASLGCGRILQKLLSHGAHVDARIVDTKWCPLHFAAQQGPGCRCSTAAGWCSRGISRLRGSHSAAPGRRMWAICCMPRAACAQRQVGGD